jgi:hypothetical protein
MDITGMGFHPEPDLERPQPFAMAYLFQFFSCFRANEFDIDKTTGCEIWLSLILL